MLLDEDTEPLEDLISFRQCRRLGIAGNRLDTAQSFDQFIGELDRSRKRRLSQEEVASHRLDRIGQTLGRGRDEPPEIEQPAAERKLTLPPPAANALQDHHGLIMFFSRQRELEPVFQHRFLGEGEIGQGVERIDLPVAHRRFTQDAAIESGGDAR